MYSTQHYLTCPPKSHVTQYTRIGANIIPMSRRFTPHHITTPAVTVTAIVNLEKPW